MPGGGPASTGGSIATGTRPLQMMRLSLEDSEGLRGCGARSRAAGKCPKPGADEPAPRDGKSRLQCMRHAAGEGSRRLWMSRAAVDRMFANTRTGGAAVVTPPAGVGGMPRRCSCCGKRRAMSIDGGGRKRSARPLCPPSHASASRPSQEPDLGVSDLCPDGRSVRKFPTDSVSSPSASPLLQSSDIAREGREVPLSVSQQLVVDLRSARVEAVENPSGLAPTNFDRPEDGQIVPRLGSASLLRLAAAARPLGYEVVSVELRDRSMKVLPIEQDEQLRESVVEALRSNDLDTVKELLRGDRGPYTVVSVGLVDLEDRDVEIGRLGVLRSRANDVAEHLFAPLWAKLRLS